MIPFSVPTGDILFSPEHVAGAAGFDAWGPQKTRDVLEHFGQFAKGAIAPLNAGGDTQKAPLENGRMRMTDGFGTAYEELAAPEVHGGAVLSPVIGAGCLRYSPAPIVLKEGGAAT